MNVVSFSLYGTAPKYIHGMVRNIYLAQKFYPRWLIRIYCDDYCYDLLTAHDSDRVYISSGVFITRGDDWCPPMLQRYLIADTLGVERFICRDADSRISQREVDAVNEWIQSDRICHVMRDHPAHQTMPGGMLGIQPRRATWEMPKMEQLIRNYLASTNVPDLAAYQVDQDFLAKVLWPMFKDSMIQHDSCPNRRNELGAKAWPTPRTDWPRFVGEVWNVDENGNESPRPGDWESVPKE